MRRFFLTGCALLFLGTLPGAGGTKELKCSLTGKKIETCCCQQKDGKLYCPLAEKTIEQCCCGSVK
jgi:hypothetical protein